MIGTERVLKIRWQRLWQILVVLITCTALVACDSDVEPRSRSGPDDGVAGTTASDNRVSNLPTPRRARDQRPNVVVILTDDMRADELRYLPRTQALLRGTTFTNAISPHPLCCPARAMLHTGQYAQNNGVQSNDGPNGGFRALRDPEATVARWLHDTGYLTALHGKYMNHYLRTDPVQRGWDVWDPVVGAPSRYTEFEFYDGDRYSHDYITARLAQRSEATVRALAGPGSPFYLFVNHTAPHPAVRYSDSGTAQLAPIPEAKYADLEVSERAPSIDAPSFGRLGTWPDGFGKRMRSERQVQRWFEGRVRSLRSVDDAVASLVRTLEDFGELENTYIVVTSDNGFSLGEHSYLTKNILARESLKVPLLISGPRVRQRRSDALVSLLDVPATILDLASARPGVKFDGLTLKSLLQGSRTSWRRTMLVQTGQNRVDPGHQSWRTRGVLTRRYLYIRDLLRPDDSRLYDHRFDPYELDDVLQDPSYSGVRLNLERMLARLTSCSGVRSCNSLHQSLATN